MKKFAHSKNKNEFMEKLISISSLSNQTKPFLYYNVTANALSITFNKE